MLIQHSMTPGHRPWKKFILTGGTLSAAWWPCAPFTWNNSISLALILCILTWTTPHGLNVISAIPPFIYSVQPGNLFKLSDPNIFFAHSFVVGSFWYPFYFYFLDLCCLFLVFLVQSFKMARWKRCPDGGEKKRKKTDDDKSKWHGEGSGRGRLNHAGDKIGSFKADTMAGCIAEIHFWENKAEAEGKERPDKQNSRNQICKRHGLSPSTVSKWMTGKVQGLGPQLGGARQSRVLTASR